MSQLPNHERPLDASHCSLCARYHSDPRYRALVDGTAKPAQQGQRAPRQAAKPKKPDCIHLGQALPNQPRCGCGEKIRKCDMHSQCRVAVEKDDVACCRTCKDFEADADTEEHSPRVGVVIGHYKWPELIGLQIQVIRETCGPVPILVSDDCTEGFPDCGRYARLQEICAAHPDVMLWPNSERIGHTGGDLSAFWKGVTWGASRGLQVVAKLSQRFLVTRKGWLQDGSTDLLASGLPLATHKLASETRPTDLRTEAMLLDVRQWNRPEVLERIKLRRYWQDRPGGICAEEILFTLLHDLLGGIYWPWKLFGPDRKKRSDGVIWHNSHSLRDYQELAANHGVEFDADFHADGWEADLRAGEYSYG